jgi:hypothetical protein
LLPHIISGCNSAHQNIRSEATVDIVTQKHHTSPAWPRYLAFVIFHVKRFLT